MRRNTNRIRVSHAGTTPRPGELLALRETGGSDPALLARAVDEVVKRQVEVGIDIVNDGELSKSNFTNYVRDRLGGIEPANAGTIARGLPPRHLNARDLREFPEFFGSGGGGFGRGRAGAAIGGFPPPMIVSGPITYVGEQTAQTDVANLQAAMRGVGSPEVEAFLPAVAPG